MEVPPDVLLSPPGEADSVTQPVFYTFSPPGSPLVSYPTVFSGLVLPSTMAAFNRDVIACILSYIFTACYWPPSSLRLTLHAVQMASKLFYHEAARHCSCSGFKTAIP